MSRFHPTNIVIDPPSSVDPLGEALHLNLRRFIRRAQPWGAPLMFVCGLLSLGFVPLVFHARRFLHHAAVERNQWRHIVEWIESHNGREMTEFARDIESSRTPRWWVGLIGLALVIAAASAGLLIHRAGSDGWSALAGISVWGWKPGAPLAGPVFVGAMTIGYAMFHLMIVRHQRWMQRLAQRFAAVTLRPVEPASRLRARSGSWFAFAGVSIVLGLPWAAIMMLAGAAQSGYITRTSVATRAAIARSLREMRSHESGVGVSPTHD